MCVPNKIHHRKKHTIFSPLFITSLTNLYPIVDIGYYLAVATLGLAIIDKYKINDCKMIEFR